MLTHLWEIKQNSVTGSCKQSPRVLTNKLTDHWQLVPLQFFATIFKFQILSQQSNKWGLVCSTLCNSGGARHVSLVQEESISCTINKAKKKKTNIYLIFVIIFFISILCTECINRVGHTCIVIFKLNVVHIKKDICTQSTEVWWPLF